jgi:hypothetical protein
MALVWVMAFTKLQLADLPAFLEERVLDMTQSMAGFALEASYAAAAGPMTLNETRSDPDAALVLLSGNGYGDLSSFGDPITDLSPMVGLKKSGYGAMSPA